MEEKTWPTFKSCNQKRSKASVVHLTDRLSSLPDEALLNIWSHLTTKEAARASLVSRMCKQMWLVHPFLKFEHKNARLIIPSNYGKLILEERSTFIERVDNIVKHHLGPVIDEFRIAFDLIQENESHIDNWLVFAFSKQVKRLELDLKQFGSEGKREPYDLKMPVEYQVSSNFGTFKSALTSLCLASINLTAQVIESFLDSFPSLEILCIRLIHSFTSITASSSLRLKHLEVTDCGSLDTIDLRVPHLLSFTCQGQPTRLHFRNASSLSAVSIGSFLICDLIAYAISCLLIYCAQLEYLELKSNLVEKHNWQINDCPEFTNLKHLTLNIVIPLESNSLWTPVNEDPSILGWTPVIKACPVLEKLTLKLESPAPSVFRFSRSFLRKLDAHPLSTLKTLEIVGFLGHCVNLELVMYVIENADMLEEIVIDDISPYLRNGAYWPRVRSIDLESHKVALGLLEILPPTVKLIFR